MSNELTPLEVIRLHRLYHEVSRFFASVSTNPMCGDISALGFYVQSLRSRTFDHQKQGYYAIWVSDFDQERIFDAIKAIKVVNPDTSADLIDCLQALKGHGQKKSKVRIAVCETERQAIAVSHILCEAGFSVKINDPEASAPGCQ